MTTDDKRNSPGAKVAVIGGGIAGITTAIKLHQQGYQVTLFEKAERLGGNLSSDSPDNNGDPRDVYPHIFGDWYNEFWYLFEHDLGLKREDHFAPRANIRLVELPMPLEKRKGFGDVNFTSQATPTSLANLVNNCQGEVVSARDMFLFGYSYVDLVSMPIESRRSKVLNDLDVTGYLYSRPYMNDAVAGLHDDLLKVIWSTPSDQTAAKAYQKLLRHTLTFPNETPFAWLLKGPLQDKLMRRVKEKLGGALGSSLKLSTQVVGLELDKRDKFAKVSWKGPGPEGPNSEGVEEFRYVVIATPPEAAAELVIQSTGANLAERHPTLARLREVATGRIPVVYVRLTEDFRKKHKHDLDALPTELIGFKRRGSPSSQDPRDGSTSGNYDISMLNLCGLWEDEFLDPNHKGEPVILLAASHADAIEAPGPKEPNYNGGRSQGFAMLARLQEYFPFINIGKHWDDKSAGVDIDWDRTYVVDNQNHQLFLNSVGSNQWRPNATLRFYKRTSKKPCRNVFFAGDYCMTPVDMATVEAAVQSGVLAARALMDEDGRDADKLPLQPHALYTTDALLLAKLVSAPAAFAAALSATFDEASDDPVRALTFPMSAAVLAASYGSDWLRSAEQFWRFQIPGYRRSSYKQWDWREVSREDETIGIFGMAANLALALVVEGPKVAPQVRQDVAEVLYKTWHGAIGRHYFPKLRATLKDPHASGRRDGGKHDSDRKAEAVPDSWSGLIRRDLDGGKVGSAVSNAAFGLAAAGVHLVKSLTKPGDQTSDDKPPNLRKLVRKSLKHGDAARRRKATGYRYYDTPNRL